MAEPFNYAAILNTAQAGMPDFARDEAFKRLSSAQTQGLEIQNRAAQQALDQQAAFQSDMERVLVDPSAQNYANLILKYPKYATEIKNAHGVLDEQQRRTDLRQMGEIYSAASSGRFDLAASALERRIEADKAATGQADPDDERLLAAFKGAPAEQKAAMGQVGVILSAITGPDKFGSTFGAITKGNEDFTLVPGARRFDAQGNIIAQAPFAPRPVTVGEGQTVVEYQPGGGDPASSGGGAGLFQRVLEAEGGTDPQGNFRTSPKGAIGPAQIMPGTAPEAAALAGLPYDENRLRTDPQYNMQLGRAYLDAQLQRYGGNEQLAAAAYNAGPGAVDAALQRGGTEGWINHVPAETQAYVRKVTGQPQSGGGPRVIAQGNPKPKKPTETRVYQGKTYFKIDGRWFDNAEGR